MSDWVDVAAAEELPPGARRVVDVDGVEILVINLDGEFFALENVCTHEATPIDEGDVHGDEITCPRHGARFSIRTGEALCAPAYEPIPTFPVRTNAGIVQVRDPRFD